jgi:hypothetical protein
MQPHNDLLRLAGVCCVTVAVSMAVVAANLDAVIDAVWLVLATSCVCHHLFLQHAGMCCAAAVAVAIKLAVHMWKGGRQ